MEDMGNKFPSEKQGFSEDGHLPLERDLHAAIAGRLLSLRKGKGMRMKDAAAALGISKSQISRIERGQQGVSVVELMRFAHLYGVNVAHFFLEEDTTPVKVTRRKERRR